MNDRVPHIVTAPLARGTPDPDPYQRNGKARRALLLTLGVLRRLASPLEPVFLAFLYPGISGE
jgi:hypothetical protein